MHLLKSIKSPPLVTTVQILSYHRFLSHPHEGDYQINLSKLENQVVVERKFVLAESNFKLFY